MNFLATSGPCIEYKQNLNNVYHWKKYRSVGPSGINLENPACDSRGYFEKQQCSKNYCWCVHDDTGIQLLHTTTKIENKEKLCCKKGNYIFEYMQL